MSDVILQEETKVEETQNNAAVSFTELTKNMFAEDAIQPWHRPERRCTIAESFDSIYEAASADGLPVFDFIAKDPEMAVMFVEKSYAKWLNVLTQGAIEGRLNTDKGVINLTKNQTKVLEIRLEQAKHELEFVTDYAMSITGNDGKKRNHLLRTLYMNAVMHRDTKALIYLIDRVDGRPGETRVESLSYDNAYNIYMIIHTLFDKQLTVLNAGNGTVLVCCSRRAGKCWSPDTLLRTYGGRLIRADEVKVGDILMGSHSEPQKVLSTTAGRDQMFRVRSVKRSAGIDFTCNSVHVLTVVCTEDLSKKRGGWEKYYKQGETYDIQLDEFLKLPDYVRRQFAMYRSRTEYEENPHVIPPYLMGLWLGDGDKDRMAITMGLEEKEIREYCHNFAKENGLTAREDVKEKGSKNGSGRKIFIIGKGGLIHKELKELGVFKNKHIPESYMIDSVENRLQLLAGLIDSDGYVDKRRGNPEFAVTDKKLAEDVFELACSLGYRVCFRTATKKYYSEAKNKILYIDVYTVTIKGSCSEIPVLQPRKKCRDSEQSTTYRFDITPVGEGDYAGFTLDGDGRLLLADYTVTHNSHMLVAGALIECLRKPNTTCIYIGETMDLTEGIVDDAMNKIIDSCHLQDKKGNRFNWRKMDNHSKLLVRGLSNTKDPDQIRGKGAKVIIIDEFFHLKSELLQYLQDEVLQPMQMDYADDYKFICAGTPPQIRGTYGEMAWKNWDVPHFHWTWRDNPHPVSVEAREQFVNNEIAKKGLTWDMPAVRREYLGEWAYDDELVLYPDYKTFNKKEAFPAWKISRVIIGIDYGVSDNDCLFALAWSDDEGRGYELFETKFNRLDIKDKSITQLEYLKEKVKECWILALNVLMTAPESTYNAESLKQLNKNILWSADDNDQHLTDELAVNVNLSEFGEKYEKLAMQIENAHKTEKKMMWDKTNELFRTGRLLLQEGGDAEHECISTIMLRGPNGEVYSEIDDRAYHPDLIVAMRYALWNVLGNR